MTGTPNFEQKGVSWLEPARAWVKSLNQADKLLSSGDKSEMTTFLKQIGSNHILIDKSFSFSPKKPFQILAERRASRREASSFHLRNPELRCNHILCANLFREPMTAHAPRAWWLETASYA